MVYTRQSEEPMAKRLRKYPSDDFSGQRIRSPSPNFEILPSLSRSPFNIRFQKRSQSPSICTNPRFRRHSLGVYKSYSQQELVDSETQTSPPPPKANMDEQSQATVTERSRPRQKRHAIQSMCRKVQRMCRGLGGEKTNQKKTVADNEALPCPSSDAGRGLTTSSTTRPAVHYLEPRPPPAADDDRQRDLPSARLLRKNKDGTRIVLLEKRTNGSFGFFVIPESANSGRVLIISRLLSDDIAQQYAGILNVGDQLVSVDKTSCSAMTLDQLHKLVSNRTSLEVCVLGQEYLL